MYIFLPLLCSLSLHMYALGSITMNKIVISVNEQCDGTAESIINDVSGELKKLRDCWCSWFANI